MTESYRFASWRPLRGPASGLVAVLLFFSIAEFFHEFHKSRQPIGQFVGNYSSRFLTARNARTVLIQTATVAAAALGMTWIIIAGGIDLSAGSVLALAATALAWMLHADYSGWAAVAACLGVGTAAGFFNGWLVSTLRLVPFIVTLGSMTIYLGLAKLIAGETTISPASAKIPNWLTMLVANPPRPAWLIVAPAVWLVLVLAVVLSVLLRHTRLGRHAIAIGSNERAAWLSGIRIPRAKIAIYSLAGFLIGVAGMLQFTRLSSGNPTSGTGMELKMIASVVVGGGSLQGGRGSLAGTLIGALIIASISSGCTQLELKNPIQDMLIGAIIIGAVLLDRTRQ